VRVKLLGPLCTLSIVIIQPLQPNGGHILIAIVL